MLECWNGGVMKEVIRLARGKKKELMSSAVLAAAGSMLTIVPYILIYYIIQYYIRNGAGAPPGTVIRLIIWGFAAVALRYILTTSAFVFSHIAAFDLLYKIRARLARHLGTLPMGYWSRRTTGHVRKIIQEDVEMIENFIAHHVPDFVSGLVVPVVTLGYLYFVDWRLAIAATVPLVIGLMLMKLMYSGSGRAVGRAGSSRQEMMKLYHDSLEDMHSRTVEYVQGMPVVKVFNLTVSSFQKLKASITRYGELVEKWSRGGAPFWAGFTSIVLGGGIFILPVALILLRSGQTDVPTVILFLLLGTGCLSGAVKFMTMLSGSMMIKEGASRIRAVLDTESMPEPVSLSTPRGYELKLHQIGFRYSDDSSRVLDNISITVPEGQFIAFVGPSGAGKTTLVQLIARIWDATDGRITIGEEDIRNLGSEQVNRIVGTVFQDVQMLTANVRDNIRMGNTEASDTEIIAAAKAAAIHDFVTSLPRGYDTLIGEGGEVHLSGGEKQRISIARVILNNPPIILLDEATAYADAENETRIQKAFSNATQDKTVIVIAHRLSTVVKAHKIYVMDGGRIVQQGNHEHLGNDTGGLYHKMWQAHTNAGKWTFTDFPSEGLEKAV